MTPNSQIPRTAEERRQWIKYRLALAGYSLRKLSKELGNEGTAAQKALIRPYPRMEAAIAAKIGISKELLWPERYARRRRRRLKGSRRNINIMSSLGGEA